MVDDITFVDDWPGPSIAGAGLRPGSLPRGPVDTEWPAPKYGPIEKSANGRPGKVVKVRTYELTPGKVHVYNEGDLHSPRRESETRLIRIEGVDLTTVKRDKFEIAA